MPFELTPGRVIHTDDVGQIDAEMQFDVPKGEAPFAITFAEFKNKMAGSRVQRVMMQMIMASLRENIGQTLRSVLGRPYQLQGNTPEEGFDAGGLIQYVYNHVFGVSFPQNIAKQFTLVQQVTLAEAMPGDILVWGSLVVPTAAGVYLGGGKYITVDMLNDVVQIKAVTQSWLPDVVGSLR